MRLRFAPAALGLAIRCVAGQEQWQGFGALPELLRKSFYDAVARSPSLAKRDGTCGEGAHPCSDVNSTFCCSNTNYCVVNTSLGVQCCPLGSACGLPCAEGDYLAVVTTTAQPPAPPATGTATVCLGRPCPATHYLCPPPMGAGCCAYGQDCASGGLCLDYGARGGATSTSRAAGPTVATAIPSGCSRQGESPCSVGGIAGVAPASGCCGAGYACALSGSQAVCTRAPSTTSASPSGPTPTGPGVSAVPQSRGLSGGAKAGIAVAVVLAAAAVIGAATWFCIRRRRGLGAGATTTTGNEMASGVGGSGGGRRNHLAAAGRYESDDGGLRAYGPSSGPHMSEADGFEASSSGPGGGPLQGTAHDYFGPAAASRPYTTPPEHPGSSPDHVARPVRGEAGTPHGPDDIAAPVEMGSGSEGSLRPNNQAKSGGELDGSAIVARRHQQQQGMRQGPGSPTVRDSIAGRFELDAGGGGGARGAAVDARAPRPLGTPASELSASELGTPSPMSHEEQQQQQDGARRAAGS